MDHCKLLRHWRGTTGVRAISRLPGAGTLASPGSIDSQQLCGLQAPHPPHKDSRFSSSVQNINQDPKKQELCSSSGTGEKLMSLDPIYLSTLLTFLNQSSSHCNPALAPTICPPWTSTAVWVLVSPKPSTTCQA